MDTTNAVDSAAMPGQACVLASRGLFFAAVLLGFLLLGMASASADDDGQQSGKPAASGSSETGNDTPQNAPPDEPADPQPETSPEPGKTPQGEGERQTDNPVEDVLETPPPSDAQPAQPTTPEPPEQEQSTQSMPAEPTSSPPPPDQSEPAAPAPPADNGSGGDSGGESGSTEGKTPVIKPVAEGVEETVKNTNELVLDKPEKLVKATKKTVENTTGALTSKDPSDRSVRNLTKAATEPLAKEVSATLDDTVELTRRQAGVVRKSVTGVRNDLDRIDRDLRDGIDKGLGEGLGDGLGGPANGPDQQPIPDVDQQEPGTHMLPTPLKTPERADVPRKPTTSPQESRGSVHLEPTSYDDSGEVSSATDDPAAQMAAPGSLDISPVMGGGSTSSDSTGGGAGSSAAACGAESFTMRLGAGHKLVAAPGAVVPHAVSLQPGFSPD